MITMDADLAKKFSASAQTTAHHNIKFRKEAKSSDPTILTDIYKEENNIVIWRRQLSEHLTNEVTKLLESQRKLQAVISVSPQQVHSSISKLLGEDSSTLLKNDIAELVDMFCCLFDLQHCGLRLTTLDNAMCPKFHVDKVPCRLVTTYHGIATEWLPHQLVNRSKLGAGSVGKSDAESGIYQCPSDIQQLTCGDVGLLKGELWPGNENAGLVHRSPAVPNTQKRILLTLDYIN